MENIKVAGHCEASITEEEDSAIKNVTLATFSLLVKKGVPRPARSVWALSV